jgi:hypothetical protein
MFKCTECGYLFDEPDTWKEPHGEILGGCPCCAGHFDEACQCELCGDWFTEDELTMGVCDECINEYSAYKDCKDVFEGETAEAKIDYLAYMLLDEATINDILRRYLAERLSDADCTEAIEADKSWFVEKLVEKMKGDQ